MEQLTTADLLLRRATQLEPALFFEDAQWNWREFARECAARAELLREVRPSASGRPHIGVLLDNSPEYLFWIGGAALAGATVVGLNPTRRGAQLGADVRHTECELLVTDTELVELCEGLDTGVARTLLVDSPEYASSCERIGRSLPSELEDVATQADPDAPLLLLFTSGSTGSPKAVLCGSRRFAALGSANICGLTAQDVCYCPMPMFHGNALMACWAPALAVGAPVALRRKFSASGFLPDVLRFGATFFTYVGRSLSYVLAQPEDPREARTSLRKCFGTEASPTDRAEFERRFAGCRVIESYGSSEGAVSIRRTAETPAGALGPAPEGMDLIVAEPDGDRERPPAEFSAGGRLLNPDGAIGEIVHRDGARLFEGYYRNADAESERVDGAWFRTGDLAYRDAAGFFYFAGRGGDRLRVDGENFAAAPVEAVLCRYDPVLAAAVYAVPDVRAGDQVMAALQVGPDARFDPAAFAEFLARQPDLGTKWAPRYLRIVPELPATATRKVDKPALRRQLWEPAQGETLYHRSGRELTYRELGDSDRAELEAELREHGRWPPLAWAS